MRSMKITPLINFAVLVFIGCAAYLGTLYLDRQIPNIKTAPESVLKQTENNQSVPNFSFTGTDGKTLSIKDFQGKFIILNFWASWCTPCIKELPLFLKAAGENPENLIFIGLSSDLDKEKMMHFLKKQNFDISQKNIFFALDSENITQSLFQTFRLPETILIDKNQIMRTKIISADWTYEELISKIKALQTPQQ